MSYFQVGYIGSQMLMFQKYIRSVDSIFRNTRYGIGILINLLQLRCFSYFLKNLE